ncbi:Ppx/GppA phosphatase family protein [Devosia algicola]|uniref:Ppx/GppA phosphatase family protein n=1 Tax=Devosia algicola TaxID=3026418 RepID=UPI002E1C725E
MNQFWGVDADPTAQGRIKGAKPVAVLDIGSNSVRLVVYERHARSLTPLYNEKAACALGRGMATSGKLADDNMERALTAIKRFALVVRLMRVGKVHVLATSAVREATNRDAFVAEVEAIMDNPVNVLSGEQEAHFAALGVVAGIPEFSGLIGDLGGGSLELSTIADRTDTNGETHELGVIRLQDDSDRSPSKAADIVRDRLKRSKLDVESVGGRFCAIGGTWRSLAKLHQVLRGYPLHMVQHYSVPANDMKSLCAEIIEGGKSYTGSENVSSSRRDLVPYGAAVLGELLKRGKFDNVVFSALGVREGYLFGMLDKREQAVDPLLQASEELSVLRSRSPAHASDLMTFTSQFIGVSGIEESEGERRLREVSCLLADLGWRAHPDYRGPQSVDAIAYGSLIGIDHPGRAFLAQAIAVRYGGVKNKIGAGPLQELAGDAGNARARLIGALFRVAYPMSAAMPGILPRIKFDVQAGVLVLLLPADLVFLDGEHLRNRLDQFGGVSGYKQTSVQVAI